MKCLRQSPLARTGCLHLSMLQVSAELSPDAGVAAFCFFASVLLSSAMAAGHFRRNRPGVKPRSCGPAAPGRGRETGMKIELADRIRELPPYLFARIDALKNEERKKGKDLIDLGIGDPDLPTPEHIVAALAEAGRDPSTHRYPSYVGMQAFREAAA